MPIVLFIREEDEVHSVLLSHKPIVMGRSSSCDIRLSDEKISSRHIALKVNSSGKVIIKDLGSTNGTYLNGSLIEESLLMLEDQLFIGAVSLWIDPDQLSIREKQILTRVDGATKLKFINLKGSNTKGLATKAPIAPPEVRQEESAQVKSKNNRYSKPADSATNSYSSKDQALFDLEESSGNTQFIEVPKTSSNDKMRKKSISKNRTKTEPKKSRSLLNFLFSFIKKRS